MTHRMRRCLKTFWTVFNYSYYAQQFRNEFSSQVTKTNGSVVWCSGSGIKSSSMYNSFGIFTAAVHSARLMDLWSSHFGLLSLTFFSFVSGKDVIFFIFICFQLLSIPSSLNSIIIEFWIHHFRKETINLLWSVLAHFCSRACELAFASHSVLAVFHFCLHTAVRSSITSLLWLSEAQDIWSRRAEPKSYKNQTL